MMNEHQASHEIVMQAVRDSAAALLQSNPDLSKQLTEYADAEMKETEGMEMKENDVATVKLFKDSAQALQASNPGLADKLTMAADKKAMKQKLGGAETEKEEAGEEPEAMPETKGSSDY